MAAERQPHSQAQREDSPVAILTRHSSATDAPLIAGPPRARCPSTAVRVASSRWHKKHMSVLSCRSCRRPRPFASCAGTTKIESGAAAVGTGEDVTRARARARAREEQDVHADLAVR
jgi:hypothetical protein